MRLAAGDPVRINVAGWSPDERYVAVRVFSFFNPADFAGGATPPKPCRGYVDEQGKPVQGTFELIIVDGAKLAARLLIQDGTNDKGPTDDGCTPVAVATKRLADAKAKLKALGVDVAAVGTTLAVTKPMSVVPPGQKTAQTIKLDHWSETRETEGMLVTIGTFALRQGERVIKRTKTQAENTGAMGSTDSLSVGPGFASPSGKTIVFFVVEDFTSGRGNAHTPWVFGVFQWQGDQLTAR